jgi:hypothetical protein
MYRAPNTAVSTLYAPTSILRAVGGAVHFSPIAICWWRNLCYMTPAAGKRQHLCGFLRAASAALR